MFNKLNRKFYYWHFFLALLVLKYVIFCIIEVRQYLYISNPQVPADLKPYLTAADYVRLRKQEMDSFVYGFFESFAHCAIFLLTFCFGFLGRCWAAFEKWCDGTSRFKWAVGPKRPFGRSLVFYLLYVAFQFMIVLPILLLPRLLHWISSEDASDNDAFDNSLLSLWGIKLDFYTPNPLSLLLFIVNAFCVHRTVNRSYGFTLLLLIPLSLVFHFIFVLLPPALATNGGNPSLMKGIALFIPLLNKVKFPLDRVFLQKNLVNAFVSGIGRFAIMVIGTGLRTKLQLTPLELRAVVGHELGHWALNHLVYLNLAFVLINITSLVIFVFLVRNRAFYRSFDINIGPEQPIPIGVGLVLATGFLQLFLFYYKPFLNILSQLFEYQADAFSVSLGQGADLLSAMPKMHPSGLKLADYLYGLFTSNHPVYSSRAAAIAKGIRH